MCSSIIKIYSINIKIIMKLKYLVETDDRYIFANALDDLASYHKITLAGIRYRMKKDLINIQKINIKLQDIVCKYDIDKNGIVSVLKAEIVSDCQDNQTASALDNKKG